MLILSCQGLPIWGAFLYWDRSVRLLENCTGKAVSVCSVIFEETNLTYQLSQLSPQGLDTASYQHDLETTLWGAGLAQCSPDSFIK